MMKFAKKHMHKRTDTIAEQHFQADFNLFIFSKCANGLYRGLREAVRTALKWSVLVELDRHPIQSSLFNTETQGTEPSVRFTEVSEEV